MKNPGTAIYNFIKEIDTEMFKQLGFRGIGDYLCTVFGFNLLAFFKLQVAVAVAASFVAWFAEWIWNPPIAAVLILFMTLVNGWCGYQVSKRIKGEKFTFKKFSRTFGVMAADLLIMAIIHTAIKIHAYYSPLADILFGWYFANKLRQILYHLTLLKLQQGGLAVLLKNYIMNLLQSKIGADLIDSVQKDGIKMDGIKMPLPQQPKPEKTNEPNLE